MKTKSRLVKSFFRNFALLIALPVFMVMAVSLWLMYNIMFESSVENIRLTHGNIVSKLESEATDISMMLSHFVNADKNRALDIAARYNASDSPSGRRAAAGELKFLFDEMFPPTSMITAVQIIMKDGGQLCLKDDIAFSTEMIRRTAWYRRALDQPGRVINNTLSGSVTYAMPLQYTRSVPVVAAISPGGSDRSGRIEMVCLYIQSQAKNLIEKNSRRPEIELMLLFNTDGETVAGTAIPDSRLGEALSSAADGEFRFKKKNTLYFCVVSSVAMGGMRIATAANINVMLSGFYQISGTVFAVACILFILYVLFSLMFLKGVLLPVSRLNRAISGVHDSATLIEVEESGQPELRELTASFNIMTHRIKSLMERAQKREREKRKAEMNALQAQINPHFLINTLNTMRFMAIAARFDSLRDMSGALIKILSGLFRQQSAFHTVKEEVELLRNYVYIMAIRYSGNFEVDFHIQAEAEELLIPRLILQPVVENSIIHGFEGKDDIGLITVKAEYGSGILRFIIKDNGCGMTPEQIENIMSTDSNPDSEADRIGVSNVNNRIKLIYGDYGLKICSKLGEYTESVVELPAKFEGSGDELL